MPQYYVENTHEAIIEKSEFDHVQKLMRERSIQKPWILHQSDIDFFRGRIICGVCGCKFWHQVGPKKRKDLHYWRHSTYNKSHVY